MDYENIHTLMDYETMDNKHKNLFNFLHIHINKYI